jgi:heterodisulfide reductase subunit C
MNIMEEEKACVEQRVIPSNEPIEFDENICIVRYPDECWYCGCCVMECPLFEKGAIKVKWPIKTDLRWKRKETGEHFRVGMADPPPPNLTPPVGGWKARS